MAPRPRQPAARFSIARSPTKRRSPATTTACRAPARSRKMARATPSCRSKRNAAGARTMSGPRRRMDGRKAPRRCVAPFRCRLVVMAKLPVAGSVKTRLACEVGVAGATRFARHAAATLLQRVRYDRRWQTTLAIAPDQGLGSRVWPRAMTRRPQGGGDLGTRVQRIFACKHAGPMLIIGTDVPGIMPAHIAEAFRRLGRHDAVLGPATDGGYWLVGLKRRPRVLRPFAKVRWSSPHALADT